MHFYTGAAGLPGRLPDGVCLRRVHIDNLTPANVYFGQDRAILLERERIKRHTLQQRRLQYHAKAA